MLRNSHENKALSWPLQALLSLPRALGFLTILPMPKAIWRFDVLPNFVLPWFPVVGLLVGLAVYLTVAAIPHPSLGPIVGLAVWVLITGGLHLDGLGDVFDGLARRGTPEERKAALRDPHLGSGGVIGLVVFLLAKYGALSVAPLGAMAAPVVGRAAAVLSMCLFPYGRPREQTLGISLWPTKRALVALLSVTVTAASLWPLTKAIGFQDLAISTCSVLFVGAVFAAFLSRIFRGLTGDCCGAVCEVSEVALLLSLYLLR